MSLTGAIMGNWWFAKEQIYDNLCPKKSKERREKAKQSAGYKAMSRFLDLTENEDIDYLIAVGESIESAYMYADIVDKARKSNIPMVDTTIEELIKVSGHNKDQVLKSIELKNLLDFFKGKGISLNDIKKIGKISSELIDKESSELIDCDTVANKIREPLDDVIRVSSLLKEYSAQRHVKPFTVQNGGGTTSKNQKKGGSRRTVQDTVSESDTVS